MTRQKRILIVAAVAALGVGGFLAARWWAADNGDGLFASGTVEATEAQLGFQAPGRIERIDVREGDPVEAGRLLARLDTRETEARLAQARAQVRAAAARLAEARRDLERSEALLAGEAIARDAFEKSQLARNVAQAEHAQARANVQALDAALANMVINASFGGIVTVRHREPGEIVPAGLPVLTVMNPDDRWVRIYIPENRIGAVHLQQQAAISTDTWPDRRYRGVVVHIAAQAEFTPKNVQTAEERVKLVYAVKVRITDDPGFELKPGMPADVRLAAAGP
jgi:HlyD family secretion protein